MLTIKYNTAFKRDFKRMAKRGKDMNSLLQVITMLANEQPLPEKYSDHALKGEWTGFRECHINPDWLLIYIIHIDTGVLEIACTGTHSDLFGM